jgi:transposase-like protein
MSHKTEMVEMLVQAGQMLVEQVSPHEVMESNLLRAWLQQVASALAAVGMSEELALWEEARKVEVNVTTEAELAIYMMSMRAILLGILHRTTNEP